MARNAAGVVSNMAATLWTLSLVVFKAGLKWRTVYNLVIVRGSVA